MSTDMDYLSEILCLAAYLAASNKSPGEIDSIALAAQKADLAGMLRAQLERLDAPHLTRRLEKGLYNRSVTPLDWETISLQGDQVRWNGNLIGHLHAFYKVVHPQETQARIAYEVFLDRFLDYAQRAFKVAALHESDADVTLFVPVGVNFNLQKVWQAFVSELFSAEGLRQTFVPLVNSIRLSGRGFSTLQVPVVSAAHALYLAAFYRANLASTEASDDWREVEITRLRAELDQAQSAKDKKRLEKGIAKLEGELEKRRERYEVTFQAYEKLKQDFPDWTSKVEAIARREMGGKAGRQLSQRGNIVAKYVSEMDSLARIQPDDYFQLPLLLVERPSPYMARKGGDSGGDVCYACGRAFPRGEVKYKASKFIFESPSQRLQSGSGQTEPKVCATCAAISFASPIKTGTDRLVIRLRHRTGGQRYLLEDQLRMLTMGELNVVAGRYALLQVSERVPKTGGSDPLSERMGGRQYALYKVASLFGSEVFREYQAEAVIGSTEVALPGRHLAGVRGLIEIFNLEHLRWWQDKRRFIAIAVGQAVRHIEREEVIFAVYELLKAWRKADLLYQGRLNVVQAGRLERLYETHWRWLMEERPKEATLFRDVAAMTGILYAFCNFVRQSVSADQQRIEVRKLIERATEPYGFIYTAAGNTKREMATLYRQADTYFCFDQARNLLTELDVDVGERGGTSEKGAPTLVFYFDDVVNAYTYLFENRYRSSKEQRDFTYTLRLSLHARFPELMEREKGE